jgi:hypothetical protein
LGTGVATGHVGTEIADLISRVGFWGSETLWVLIGVDVWQLGRMSVSSLGSEGREERIILRQRESCKKGTGLK